MNTLRDLAWWYWLITFAFLTAGLAGWHWGYCIAGTIAVVQIAHFAIRERSVTAMAVQVRVAYLMILVTAAWEPMRWLYWIPEAGTWALILTGYSTLDRVLSLMPWNRSVPLTVKLIWRTMTDAHFRDGSLNWARRLTAANLN